MKWLFLTASLLFAASAVASLSVTVDRTEISDADLIKLTIRIDNTTTASSPNFSAIERDFEIVQRSGPNQSSRISIINGKQSSEAYVTWDLRLRPKRLGKLTIPSFRLGSDVSQPITINVARQSEAMKRKMSQLVFFDTSVDTNEVYVQGQILYTIKLYYVENISGDFPAPPVIEDAVIEVIEDERRYDAITNGRRYYVLEKRYGIYPQKSGDLVIPSQTFSGYRVGPGFFSTREPILTRSKSHKITVNPKPAEFDGAHWLPATNVQLTESWINGKPQFTVGEPVNRTITITATGVASSLLPALPNEPIQGAKTYQDPPVEEQTRTPEGVNSAQTVVVGIVPTEPGTLQIPEIRIPWWNTATDKLEFATLPAQSYEVTPSAQAQAAPAQLQTTPVVETAPSATPAPNRYWQYASYALGILWLLTLASWYLSARNRVKDVQEKPIAPKHHTLKDLKQACLNGEVTRAQQLLLLWGRETYGPADSVQSLVRIIGDSALAEQIQALEDQRYSPTAQDTKWDGKPLWNTIQNLSQKKTAVKPGKVVASLNPV